MINLQNLLDDVRCYEVIRQLRWPDGVHCPRCGTAEITKQGRDTTQPARQKYRCGGCHRFFDDLTDTVLAGHHQPLRVWVLWLYFMGLNLSNGQIAQERRRTRSRQGRERTGCERSTSSCNTPLSRRLQATGRGLAAPMERSARVSGQPLRADRRPGGATQGAGTRPTPKRSAGCAPGSNPAGRKLRNCA